MVLFIAASGLSGINSEVRKLTLCQMVLVAKLFVLYYCGFVNSLESREDVRSVLNYLCVSMILQGAFCVMLYLAGLNFNAVLSTGHWHRRLIMAGEEQEFIRAVGSFPQPNGLAAYLVPLLLLQAAVSFGTVERSRTRVVAVATGLFALFASFSRAGWLGFFLCFPMLMVVLGRLRVISAVALLICMMGAALSIGPVRERVMGDDHNSAASRIPLMHLAMNMIEAHPIIGVGANTYSMAKYKYLDDSLDGAWLDQVHNMYLLVLAETGSL
jgi:O-antigen ligase